MALGVMLVVAVLTIHGVVSESFKSNNSFGYNILVGARGGGLQLTLNTVYYLSTPVENIPYEYYLAFCDADTREEELKNSIAYASHEHESQTANCQNMFAAGSGGFGASLTNIIVLAPSRAFLPILFSMRTHRRNSSLQKDVVSKSTATSSSTLNAWSVAPWLAAAA
jgi:putative ABC transport system permease protein